MGKLEPEALSSTEQPKEAAQPPSAPPRGRGRIRRTLSMLPSVGVAMLPKVACPACWPAYAGLLGSLGLGFLMNTRVLLPLTALFLLLALLMLGFRARRRNGFGPMLLGGVGATVILLAKFVSANDPALYGGVGLLVTASLWNSWPRPASQGQVGAAGAGGLITAIADRPPEGG